ncbi:MAG: alanine racemase [Streptosporangiales bacterium]|nr:alanine racemase [Streptosporangiales bacterium]MBO0891435.1 alanine racemase [Acidothermales bacterium]
MPGAPWRARDAPGPEQERGVGWENGPVSVTPAEARIDLDAVRDNVAALRGRAAPAALMAVVKADGYGHGMVPAARAALAGGAHQLGVAHIAEALALRAAGLRAPVLAWLTTPGDRYADAVAADVELSAGAGWALDEIAHAARTTGRAAAVHLKADTGLSRGGATPAEWPDLVAAAAKYEADGVVQVVGVWSHLARADEPGHPSIARQLAAFGAALDQAAAAGLRPRLRHLANSPATLTLPAARYDMVRPGLACYGLTPVPQLGPPATFGLRPAMTLLGRLAGVKRVPAGAGVSYGHTYVTDRETTLALVPLGYGDGVPRAASSRAEVLLAGRRRRIAGRVCMDQFVVDLGDDAASPGDEALLFGPGDAGEPTAQDWARLLDTISYEIVTRVGARVPRTYTGTGV